MNGVQNKPATVAGVGNGDCGYVSFIARFSKEGKALYLNKLESTGDGYVTVGSSSPTSRKQ